MGIINLILFAFMLIIGIISIVGYYQDKGEMKKTQSKILENLSSERILTEKEVALIKKVYKITLNNNTPVYSLTGSVGYIVLETNGNGQKEWLIDNVLIANKSIKILAKKGISLEEAIMKDNEVNPKIDALNKNLKTNKITEEEAKVKLDLILEKYLNNTIEFIIANPMKKDKPVYLLSYKSNEMEKATHLLT